jgi:hypothetical protein
MRSLILRATTVLACACLGACGGKAVLDPPVDAPVEPSACTDALCIAPDGQARLAETAKAFSACVADPGGPALDGPPSGLRVGAVAIVASDTEMVTLKLTLVNVLPTWVGTYPGLRLVVANGNATTETAEFGQFFGIDGCGSTGADLSLAWSQVLGATLTAQATNNLGAELLDSVVFVLNR